MGTDRCSTIIIWFLEVTRDLSYSIDVLFSGNIIVPMTA